MTISNEKRNVLLGITGSIAAYKSVELARLLVTRGYQVRVVMSEAAQQFVGPMTMQSITHYPVLTGFWDKSEEAGVEHIELANWADAIVIAPATADTLAKMAAGCADSPLLAIVLAARVPVMAAPAMNCNMYEHPQTQENLGHLRDRGVEIIEPETGSLACGWIGAGRLADPWQIFYHVRRALSRHDFKGKKVLITTGATREHLDPVRYLSNTTEGKMGVELAREAFRRGADVTLVHGFAAVKVPRPITCIPVVSCAEMRDAVTSHAFENGGSDVVIMAAAAADFRPASVRAEKLKKCDLPPSLDLTLTSDILAELGERRKNLAVPVLVGFLAETGEIEELLQEARGKLRAKRVDMLVGRFAESAAELNANAVWFLDRTGKESQIAASYKSRMANQVLDAVHRLL